jgi:hypothetical protein
VRRLAAALTTLRTRGYALVEDRAGRRYDLRAVLTRHDEPALRLDDLDLLTGLGEGLHLYAVEDGPKMLRETLSVAQNSISRRENLQGKVGHNERLQRLINECERKRPTGPDGKHGDRHTDECGCEDKNPQLSLAVCGCESAPFVAVTGVSDNRLTLRMVCPVCGAHSLVIVERGQPPVVEVVAPS